MSDSIYRDASAIGAYVYAKVDRLQHSLLNSGSDSSARASLARLRRLGSPGGGAWITAGAELFEGLPELGLTAGTEKRMLNAIRASLKLYALHQQSKQQPMALRKVQDQDVAGSLRRSFGWSCRQIEIDLDKADGVLRRMTSLEAAKDFDGMEYVLRGLIQLMRNKEVPVDYYLLARDLYLVQFDSLRDEVFMRWSRDYYARVSHDVDENS